MVTIVEEFKELKSKKKFTMKEHFEKSEQITLSDAEKYGDEPFGEIKIKVFNPENYDNKVVDYISVDFISLLKAVDKMQDLI